MRTLLSPFRIPTFLTFAQFLNDSLKLSERELQEELASAKLLPEYATDRARHGLMFRLAQLNPKHQKTGIEAVKGDDGLPIFNKAESHAFLGEFWGEQFCERTIDEDKATSFCAEFSNKIPPEWQSSDLWFLPFQLFLLLLTKVKKSAPGPDGIPYSAWAASVFGIINLFVCYCMWMCNAPLPLFF